MLHRHLTLVSYHVHASHIHDVPSVLISNEGDRPKRAPKRSLSPGASTSPQPHCSSIADWTNKIRHTAPEFYVSCPPHNIIRHTSLSSLTEIRLVHRERYSHTPLRTPSPPLSHQEVSRTYQLSLKLVCHRTSGWTPGPNDASRDGWRSIDCSYCCGQRIL